ncbi:tRNA pseudouridine(55) synthase TruB [Candidatus Saccharibacteria bacterium]|nr:tRNA pseudouridine(55) synthase TruB [Candidatus Saccharibacteria bacterium]
MNEDQIILVDKPAGISSFGVVARVRAYLRRKYEHKVKVGHTGTLDPFATGLLILLAGKMTKRSGEFLKQDKVYEAEMRLGATSTTGDPEGEITFCSDRQPSQAEVADAIAGFVGEISQTVPRYSAVKINGVRAYKLARAEKDFTPPTRTVTIYAVDLVEYNYPKVVIRVHCSSGTYVRTLGEDIGRALGTGAYLTSLRRISIGEYNVNDAQRLEEFAE